VRVLMPYGLAIDSGNPDQIPVAAVGLLAALMLQGNVGEARAAYQIAIDSGNVKQPV
jgi:hypothetical protein